ncbi:MAG: Mur ligase family protein [Planctomycetota bacterium]
MDYPAAVPYLESFINYATGTGKDFPRHMKKLHRIRTILDRHGNPYQGLPVVLVTGTKGKGSTAVMLAAILKRAGYRVGTYLSPHLVSVRERIRLNGRPVSKPLFARTITRLQPYLDTFADRRAAATPSYFEILTAAAFMLFRERTDLAVMEIGMGGRYDATNMAEPLVSVITPISLEHTQFLGKTVTLIAGEKAGIMRTRRPVVCTARHPDALRVITRTARALTARLLRIDRDFRVTDEKGGTVRITALGHTVGRIHIPMPGRHQSENAAAAVTAAFLLRDAGYRIAPAAIREGIARARLAGRIDLVRRSPLTVIDTAHTVDSVRALGDTIAQRWPGRPIHAVFNLSLDKDLKNIARVFPAGIRSVTIPPTGSIRNYAPRALQARLRRAGIASVTAASVAAAIRSSSRKAGHDGIVLIFGSFFLAGKAYEYFGQAD